MGTLGLIAVLACACGGGSEPGGLREPTRASDDTGAAADDGAGDDDVLVESSATPDPAGEPEPQAQPQPQTYCDDASTIPGVKLIDDALATDAAQFAVAPGFTAASWSFAEEAYRQTRLVNAADAMFFVGDALIGDVDVQVAAASTDVTSTLGPRLRQMFVLVGASSTGGTLDAYGCGVEVVQGMSPEQRTSVVKLSGNADAVTTEAIDRTPRNILKEGEPFSIRAQLKDGTLTCTVSQGADVVTTAQASNLVNVKGSIGFFTRQTKAAFKNVKACKLEKPTSQPK